MGSQKQRHPPQGRQLRRMAVVLLLHITAVSGFESSTRLLPVQRCARKTPARTQRPRMRTRVCLRAICASAPSAITHAWRLRMPAGCESRHALRRHHRWGGSLVPAGGRLRRASGANARSCKSFASLCACDTCMSTRGPRNFVCEYPHVYASPCARACDGALAHIACVRACLRGRVR